MWLLRENCARQMGRCASNIRPSRVCARAERASPSNRNEGGRLRRWCSSCRSTGTVRSARDPPWLCNETPPPPKQTAPTKYCRLRSPCTDFYLVFFFSPFSRSTPSHTFTVATSEEHFIDFSGIGNCFIGFYWVLLGFTGFRMFLWQLLRIRTILASAVDAN